MRIIKDNGYRPVKIKYPPIEARLKICASFGCGKKLTLPEQLAGTKCTNCMNKRKLNVDLVIKYP